MTATRRTPSSDSKPIISFGGLWPSMAAERACYRSSRTRSSQRGSGTRGARGSRANISADAAASRAGSLKSKRWAPTGDRFLANSDRREVPLEALARGAVAGNTPVEQPDSATTPIAIDVPEEHAAVVGRAGAQLVAIGCQAVLCAVTVDGQELVCEHQDGVARLAAFS